MRLAVHQCSADIDHREPVLRPLDAAETEALLAPTEYIPSARRRRKSRPRSRGRSDRVFRSSSSSSRWTSLNHFLGKRLVAHLDDGELAAAAGLLDVARLELDLLGERLAIRHHAACRRSPARHDRAPACGSTTSRCSSPMPLRISWFVSGSVFVFSVGSSRTILPRASASLVSSTSLSGMHRLRNHRIGEANFFQHDRARLGSTGCGPWWYASSQRRQRFRRRRRLPSRSRRSPNNR